MGRFGDDREYPARLSRRGFLRRGVGIGLTAMAVPLLAACGAPAAAPTPAPTSPPSAPTTAAAKPAASASPAAAASPAASPSAAAQASPAAATSASADLRVSKSGFKGTLQYWVLGYQPAGANQTGVLMDAAVAAFMKANPDIKVEITGYTGDQAGFTKLTQAVQGRQSVDMFRLPSDILPLLVRDGLVAPIDEFLTDADRADIFPSLLDSVRDNGKAYSWPLWVPPVAMYMNLDIFKERNVEPPKGNWTYDQFVETAKKLTFQRANGEQVYGYTGGIDPGLVNTWSFIIGDGALPLSKDSSSYTWNTPDGISGLKKLVDLAQVHKVTPPDFGAQTVADIASGFKDRKVYAMYSEPSGSSAQYRADKLNFDIAPMPVGKSGKLQTAGGIGLISVAAIDEKQKLQAAMDLARYLTSAQVAQDVAGFYLAPGARKSVKTQDPINKFDPYVEPCYITPIIAEWPQIRTIIHPNIQNAVFGKITPQEAMAAPEAEIKGILAGRKR